ncbi:uncharacterized protein LOC142323921 [Lycorma delicatula]|uniref:uncharacterized protein LOC142323921 n=1 Tax=Lycorma delicatula TaxID=130591 RepID=UPI003F519B3E
MYCYHFQRCILVYFTLLVLHNQIHPGEMLFVPEEVPSLLSFVYNSIPPVAKGTDSRVGLGFRLGPNADFQMLFELGPQKETQTLPPIRGYESRKRHIPASLLQQQALNAANQPFIIRHSGTPGGWLSAWRNALNGRQLTLQNINDDYQNQMLSQHQNKLSYNTVQHLRQLYKEQPT